MILKTLVVMFFVSGSAIAGELHGVLKNNEGVRDFATEKAAGAFDDFTSALGDLPYSGEVHYNIGNSFLRNKEFDKAESEFKQAVRDANTGSRADQETKFRALFNSAVAMTEQKKNDEALELYQQALEIKPESLETKTNMELLAAQGGGDGGDQDQKDQKPDDKKDGKDNDKKKDDKKDDKKDGKDQKPKEPEKFDNPKPSPKPFKSQDLTQQDVKRILEELKRQEEQIRARMENEKAKEAPPGKDW